MFDPRFTRVATTVHIGLLAAGLLSVGYGVWNAVEIVLHRWKG